MNLSHIDQNFSLQKVNEPDVEWHEISEPEFSLYGIFFDQEQDCFLRFPHSVAQQVNDRIEELNRYSAGGRLRFCTDSPYVAIKAVARNVAIMRHQPIVGHYGFSLYLNNRFYGMFSPTCFQVNQFTTDNVEYDEILHVGNYGTIPGQSYSYNLFFPCYGSIKKLYVGLKQGCSLTKHAPYTYTKPVAFYGSSITQGGVASRPGNEYQGHVSRWLDTNYFNFGFSGRAKGEQVMADYFASLDASVFVIDYDYNAPDCEHLKNTHYPFYKTVRDKNPNTPIIMITRPNFGRTNDSAQRRQIVKDTFEQAIKDGDNLVWFIDGELLFIDQDRDSCTVDGVHPNDLGFFRMAKVICPVIEECLKK